jgi:NADH-quinone oxidoreductase subunit N
MVLAILPEIALLLLVAVIFVVDLVVSEERRGILATITAAGLLLTLLLTALFSRPGPEAELLWGGMLRHDWLAFIFKIIFLVGALLTTLFTIGWEPIWRKGEFYVLLLTSTIGMTLVGASGDLIMLFLAIETTSIPLYVMAGFLTKDDKSNEAGFKYLLFGAMMTAVMLYGFSLLYGFAGTTNIYELAAGIGAGAVPPAVLVGAAVLVLVGFGFKVAMVPLHFWAPDVYEGAPTPETAFLSTASKAAGFAALTRVMVAAFPVITLEWTTLVAIGAALSMTLGNLIALSQTNIKRLLAYSLHRACRLRSLGCGRRLGVGRGQRGVLLPGLCGHQHGGLWRHHRCVSRGRLRRDRRLRRTASAPAAAGIGDAAGLPVVGRHPAHGRLLRQGSRVRRGG